jgi:membrane protease subunit HflK
MAWNDKNDNKNSWNNNEENKLPDLDEVIKDFKNKLGKLLNVKMPSENKMSGGFFKYGVILAIIAWLLSGIYIVDVAEKGIVLRFGAFQEETSQGPHWHIPYPIETVHKVNVNKSREIEIGFRRTGINSNNRISGNVASESLMLTKDENIIDAKFSIQYKVNDAKKYLFNVLGPHLTLRQVAESTIRQVAGQNEMDYIFEERGIVSEIIKEKSQFLLDSYNIGLKITTFNMEDAQPPEQVQSSFDDVVKAREDKERLINEAQTYVNGILPKALGTAARMIEEAKAYKSEVSSKSEGEASRFKQILAEYEKAPSVTKERLYRETMEQVLAKSNKVIVDSKANSIMYLPIDKLIESKYRSEPVTQKQQNNTNKTESTIRNVFRSREVR